MKFTHAINLPEQKRRTVQYHARHVFVKQKNTDTLVKIIVQKKYLAQKPPLPKKSQMPLPKHDAIGRALPRHDDRAGWEALRERHFDELGRRKQWCLAHGLAPADYERVRDQLLPVVERQREAGHVRWIGVTEGFREDRGHAMLQQAVADMELAHSTMTFNTCYKDTGLFGVYAVAEPHKIQDLMWYTLESMVRMCHDTTDEEVERARTQLKANLMMSLDGSSATCEDIGRQLLTYGRRLTPAETFKRIDAVDVAAIKAAANEFINDQDCVAAAIGPVHEMPDYNWLRRRTYWLRY